MYESQRRKQTVPIDNFNSNLTMHFSYSKNNFLPNDAHGVIKIIITLRYFDI